MASVFLHNLQTESTQCSPSSALFWQSEAGDEHSSRRRRCDDSVAGPTAGLSSSTETRVLIRRGQEVTGVKPQRPEVQMSSSVCFSVRHQRGRADIRVRRARLFLKLRFSVCRNETESVHPSDGAALQLIVGFETRCSCAAHLDSYTSSKQQS